MHPSAIHQLNHKSPSSSPHQAVPIKQSSRNGGHTLCVYILIKKHHPPPFIPYRHPTMLYTMSKWLAVLATLLALLVTKSNARFHIEVAGLKVVLPTDAAKQYETGFETSLGNFGSPVYGGQLMYVDPCLRCIVGASTPRFVNVLHLFEHTNALHTDWPCGLCWRDTFVQSLTTTAPFWCAQRQARLPRFKLWL